MECPFSRASCIGRHILYESCYLFQLVHHKASWLPLKVQGWDAVLVSGAQQDGGKLGKAVSSDDAGMEQASEEPHHWDLAIARALRPLPLEVTIAYAQDGGGRSSLLLHPPAGILYTHGVMATGGYAILSEPSHQLHQDQRPFLLAHTGRVQDEDRGRLQGS